MGYFKQAGVSLKQVKNIYCIEKLPFVVKKLDTKQPLKTLAIAGDEGQFFGKDSKLVSHFLHSLIKTTLVEETGGPPHKLGTQRLER
jgi:hypothetical protein